MCSWWDRGIDHGVVWFPSGSPKHAQDARTKSEYGRVQTTRRRALIFILARSCRSTLTSRTLTRPWGPGKFRLRDEVPRSSSPPLPLPARTRKADSSRAATGILLTYIQYMLLPSRIVTWSIVDGARRDSQSDRPGPMDGRQGAGWGHARRTVDIVQWIGVWSGRNMFRSPTSIVLSAVHSCIHPRASCYCSETAAALVPPSSRSRRQMCGATWMQISSR